MLWSSRFGGQQVRFAATGLRPADANEAREAWIVAIESAHRPAALEKTIMMVTQPASLQEYFKRG